MKKQRLIAAAASMLLAIGCKKDSDEKVEQVDKDYASQRRDVARKEGAQALQDLDEARAAFVRAARAKLQEINVRIEQLEAKADAKSKEHAATLRLRRDELARKVDSAQEHAKGDWEQFEADVDRNLDDLRSEIDSAF